MYNPNSNVVREKTLAALIEQKQSCLPTPPPTDKQMMLLTTDIDHFPYTRQFRGKWDCEKPTIWGRQGGFQIRCDKGYEPPKTDIPQHIDSSYYTVYL